MKKILALVFPMLLVVFLSNGVSADPGKKLADGVVDVLSSPMEYGKSINSKIDENEPNKIIGLFVGLIDGTGQTLNKLVGGFSKIMTFPFDGEKD